MNNEENVIRGNHEIANIGLTIPAINKAKEYIKDYEFNPETNEIEKLYLRVSITGGGCSGFKYVINIDSEDRYCKGSDALITINGLDVVIDSVSLNYLQGAYVDYISQSIAGGSFQVINPNAKETCSCGESFSV